jgi:hypothetical protein
MTTATDIPPAEVIAWLKSPQGEAWSEQRLRKARLTTIVAFGSAGYASLALQGQGPVVMRGMFSIKDDYAPWNGD